MPPRTQSPDDLISVVWSDSKEKVKLPRRLLGNGSKKAQERYLIASDQLHDPSATPLPATVEEVTTEVRNEAAGQMDAEVAQLRAQLEAIQESLQGTPLSHAELVAAREEITSLMLKAADAGAQLVQVEGRGSAIKAELQAIADPLVDQAAETARQQAENNEVQQRVLDDLQAQASAPLEALSQDAAAAAVERDHC